MQLDVGVSPPAGFNLLDHCPSESVCYKDRIYMQKKLIYCLVTDIQMDDQIWGLYVEPFPRYDFFSSTFGPVTYRRKAMHKSPPCMGTGGLKNM